MKVKFDGNHSLIITIETEKGEDREAAIKTINDIDWIELFSMEDNFATDWKSYVTNEKYLRELESFLMLKELDYLLFS